MRISMVAIGSTGDVRPYVLLGKELKKRGHEVTIVCFDMTEKMVTEAGLNFAPLAGSVKDIFMAVMTPGTNGFTFLPKFKNALLDDLPQFLHTLEEGCKDAEAIICTFFGSVVYSIAEKHNIPCIQTHYFLMDYNDMFPITTAPGLKMGKAWNKVSYKMGYALINTLEWHYLSDWRSEEGMKSKKISMSPDYYINGHKIPVLYAISPLLGQAPDPKLVQEIRDRIMSYPQVLGTHDLMVHDYGPGRQFASAHVEMPGEGDAFEHHEILDTIEHDIKRQMGIAITLHCDPIATTGDDLRGWVKRGVAQIDPALSIHDLHEHDGFVSFDLVRPDGFDISDEELLELVTRIVHERRPDASCVVTFDSGFSSPERPAEQL